MKIAISGAHGQGKTTLLNALKQLELFANYKFVDSPTRSLIGTQEINESGTQDTQVHIMTQHYINQTSNNIILDRCALDGMAYTNYFISQGKLNITIADALEKMYRYLIQQYSLIFYIEPEIPLSSDGTRSIDSYFFNQIKYNFEHLIRRDQIKITSLSGTTEQRIQKFVDTFHIYNTIKYGNR